MIFHIDINRIDLLRQVKNKAISFGGNRRLKIYGTLSCKPGKRMHKENRVFFTNEKDALDHGYRPCGHCMKIAYLTWKQTHGPV